LKKIIILEGGNNEEHKVSLESSKEVKKVLIKKKIEYQSIIVNPKTFKNKINKFSNKYIFFNALHGSFGEDGQIQKILSDNKYKYTHSGILSSKNSFNKIISKNKVSKKRIPTPSYLEFKVKLLNDKLLNKIKKKYKKFVIKPIKSGSSFGIKIIKNNYDLKLFLKNLPEYKKKLINHDKIIFEKFISGKELTVSVINLRGRLISLGVTEIKTKNEYFDYKAKYTKGYAQHIIPAKISKKNYNTCLKYALKIHKILKCNTISRSDFILNLKEDKIYYLETNTQPGLTPLSLLPEQAKYNNITFENLVLELISNLI